MSIEISEEVKKRAEEMRAMREAIIKASRERKAIEEAEAKEKAKSLGKKGKAPLAGLRDKELGEGVVKTTPDYLIQPLGTMKVKIGGVDIELGRSKKSTKGFYDKHEDMSGESCEYIPSRSVRSKAKGRKVSSELLEEISGITKAQVSRGDFECVICKHEKSAEIDDEILAVGNDIENKSSFNDIARKYGVSRGDIYYHRQHCMLKRVALELDKGTGNGSSTAMRNGSYYIERLGYYLDKTDRVISRLEESEEDDKLLLSAIEEARKICETNTKMFIEVFKLKLDSRVQDDFRKIVLEVIDRVAPEARDRIISELKSRLILARTLGGDGV